MSRWIFLILLLPACSASFGATIRIEKDGSGDFVEIQPALDAAASGDTVLIGPGEFTELIPSYIPGYAWDVEVCAFVRVPNLTIIGAGADQTILGPETYKGSNQTYSPKGLVWLEGNDRIIQGITFRNCYDGIHATNGPVYVDDCGFMNNGGYGVVWHTESSGGWIRDSNFSSNIFDSTGLGVFGLGSNVLIEKCSFYGNSLDIRNIQGISFLNCEISNTLVGIQFSAGARGVVSHCTIFDCSVAGIVLSAVGPHCDIVESHVAGDQAALAAYGEATLIASNTVFEGGSVATLFFQTSGPSVIHNSHILRSGSYFVKTSQHESLGLITHDLTGNFWGTADLDQLAEWIWDQDDDTSNYSIVNYLPMADGPVPTENATWGSIKAMFH